MAVLPTQDHIGDALARMPTQYQGKPNIGALLACYVEQIQILYDGIESVMQAFMLDSAVGFRLEWLGDLVGQPRRGTSDAVYLRWIRARISANRSCGKTADIYKVAGLLLTSWTYSEEPVGVIITTTDTLTVEELSATVGMLQRAAAGAVPVNLYVVPETPFERASLGSAVANGDGELAICDGGHASYATAATDGLYSRLITGQDTGRQ
jgi:hypothetical protein